MAKLNAFTFLTLNGYYKGAKGDVSWHKHGAEEGEYAMEEIKSDSILLFGRVTYQMMASYWPTPMAEKNDPERININTRLFILLSLSCNLK